MAAGVETAPGRLLAHEAGGLGRRERAREEGGVTGLRERAPGAHREQGTVRVVDHGAHEHLGARRHRLDQDARRARTRAARGLEHLGRSDLGIGDVVDRRGALRRAAPCAAPRGRAP